ncbi:transglycosylase SLT domain-containing protein [Thermodesulfobacteriota bacterium]
MNTGPGSLNCRVRRCLVPAISTVVRVLACFMVTASLCAPGAAYSKTHYTLPEKIQKNKLTFAGVHIPLEQREVADRVVDQLNYLLMDRRASMIGWFDRMAVYGPTMRKVLRAEKIPDDMLYLAVLLSDLLPDSKKRAGGVGWWALESRKGKKTAPEGLWVTTNDWDDRRDPVLSTKIAASILKWLHGKKETGNWLLAICAYLDGVENVEEMVKKAPGFSYWDMVLPSKCEVMVPRLIALKIIDNHRALYGLNVSTPRPLAYDILRGLKLKKDLPLYLVAKWCKISPRRMWQLNPAVDPATGTFPKADKRKSQGFPLRVPRGRGSKVRQLLTENGYLTR